MMLPANISLIKYDGVRGASNGVFLGGFRADKSRSFVCGFVDRTLADKVTKNLVHEPVEVRYNVQYGVYLMNAKMRVGAADRPRKLYKPILRKKLGVMTMGTQEAAFFTLINNTELVLIDDVMEQQGLVAMKNKYVLDFEMDDSFVLRQIEERMETGEFDYARALEEIDVLFKSGGESDTVEFD